MLLNFEWSVLFRDKDYYDKKYKFGGHGVNFTKRENLFYTEKVVKQFKNNEAAVIGNRKIYLR